MKIHSLLVSYLRPIVSLFKSKGSKADWSPKYQRKTCPGHSMVSTINMIFTVRQVQAERGPLKCLYRLVNGIRYGQLGNFLFGCPNKFVNLIYLFHEAMTGYVLSGGEAWEPFSITNGVKQVRELEWVLAPVLLILFFTCMLSHAVEDLESGVCLRYTAWASRQWKGP